MRIGMRAIELLREARETFKRQAPRLIRHMDKQRFVNSTQWLRPFTRWATRFSLNSPQWLPAALRNLPLKLSSFVLRCYHMKMR